MADLTFVEIDARMFPGLACESERVPVLYRRGDWAVTPSLTCANLFTVTHVESGIAACEGNEEAGINDACELCRRLESVKIDAKAKGSDPVNAHAKEIYLQWRSEVVNAR